MKETIDKQQIREKEDQANINYSSRARIERPNSQTL